LLEEHGTKIVKAPMSQSRDEKLANKRPAHPRN